MAGKFNLAEHLKPSAVDQVRDIETITSEILDAKRAGGEAILTIGQGLIEAKGLLPHGEWLPWLTERVEFSERSAQNFMRLAREYANPQTLADLGASKALALLALPAEEREEFISAVHVVDGEKRPQRKCPPGSWPRPSGKRNRPRQICAQQRRPGIRWPRIWL